MLLSFSLSLKALLPVAPFLAIAQGTSPLTPAGLAKVLFVSYNNGKDEKYLQLTKYKNPNDT